MDVKLYSMGSDNYKWELRVAVYQNRDSYKYVLSDTDGCEIEYIGTDYLTSKTACEIDKIISNFTENWLRLENIQDIFDAISKTFYGSLFYKRSRISPQLTDGIILIC